MKDKIPDRRAMEKMTSDLLRLLQGQDFKSEEDLKAYLDGIAKGGKIPDVPPKSAVSFAQDIMYEAWKKVPGAIEWLKEQPGILSDPF